MTDEIFNQFSVFVGLGHRQQLDMLCINLYLFPKTQFVDEQGHWVLDFGYLAESPRMTAMAKEPLEAQARKLMVR
jgi:hypothetical protein